MGNGTVQYNSKNGHKFIKLLIRRDLNKMTGLQDQRKEKKLKEMDRWGVPKQTKAKERQKKPKLLTPGRRF